MFSEAFLSIVELRRKFVTEMESALVPERVGCGAVLVDVREDREWAQAHPASAMHIGRGVLERDVAGLIKDRDQEILVYCGGGLRSILAAYTLQEMGYRNVRSIRGGWAALESVLNAKLASNPSSQAG